MLIYAMNGATRAQSRLYGAALIDPTRLEDWMGPARVEPHVSGCYELFTDRAQPMAGRILTWEPPTLLELSWNNEDAPASVGRYELARDGDGTRLIFTHKGIRFARSGLMLPGWHVYLERLESLVDGVAQPLSRPRYRALQIVNAGGKMHRFSGAKIHQ